MQKKSKVASKSFVADTNAFLRLILDDIPRQRKDFEKLLLKAKQAKAIIIVPQIVIFEIEFILQKYYLFNKEDVLDKLKVLVATSYLKLESREVFIKSLKLYDSISISFVDCFLIALASIENAELFTFDKKLKKSAPI